MSGEMTRSYDCRSNETTPMRRGFALGFVIYKKGALDSQQQVIKVYQLLAHGRWFSPGTPASPTGRHDIAEILLKGALNTINQNQSNQFQQKWPRDDFCIIKGKLVSYEIYNIGINLMLQIIMSTYCS